MAVDSRYFCTLFDSNYLLKGVAMVRSLLCHCPEANIYILCMDDLALELLARLSLPGAVLIPLAAIEDQQLLQAKQDRSVAEYCWTLSSCFTWYVLMEFPSISYITYLDADIFFYSSLDPIFSEVASASIAIIEHRFSPRYIDREVNGRFCVEWVGFARDEQGLKCLAHWREQCIEWCYYRLEETRMGDQKYLDQWPSLYGECHIIKSIGAGIAPWNYDAHHIDGGLAAPIRVDGEPLIFYHFHQFQVLSGGGFHRLSPFYSSYCAEPESVYASYEMALEEVLSDIRRLEPTFSAGMASVDSSVSVSLLSKLKLKLKSGFRTAKTRLSL